MCRWIWVFKSLDFDIRSSRYLHLNILRGSENSAAKLFCCRKDFCPQVCKTELKKTEVRELIADKNWQKFGWVLGKNRKKTGIGLENLSHWITWLLLCLPLPYVFNNKRRRHCFFYFQLIKEATPFWNNPTMALFICFFFQNSTSPSATLSLLCNRSCCFFFHPLVLASSCQLGVRVPPIVRQVCSCK